MTSASPLPDLPLVQTAEGLIRGVGTPKLNVFKGVRYGEDTAGSRFRPARPVQPWTGVRDAGALGPQCYQRNIDTFPWRDPAPESEDCLFLNIWTPKDARKLPVMIWIHGGAYWWGSGGVPMYDGAAMAEGGNVVVVTLNHRLNLFGYLYLGGLSDAFADSANLGQLDLVEALKWVQRNIDQFGGDPENVTVFGESGGGMKISALLAMPSAKGLFHKAIVQSGSITRLRTEESATIEARALLDDLGIAPAELERIRTIAPGRLIEAYDALLERVPLGAIDDLPLGPVHHPATLPFQLLDAAALELWREIPLLVGGTEEETVWLLGLDGEIPMPTDDADLQRRIRILFPEVDAGRVEALIAAYRRLTPVADRRKLLVDITSGLWMWAPALRQADARVAAGGAPVFMYEYGWREPFLEETWALHGGEVAFVFDKLDLPSAYAENTNTPALRKAIDADGAASRLCEATLAAWTTFAKSGAPAGPLLPTWPPYTLAERASLRFDRDLEVRVDRFGPIVREIWQS